MDTNSLQKNSKDFIKPVLLNTIIELNLVVSKFSLQAGVLQSPAIYIFNINNIFFRSKWEKAWESWLTLRPRVEKRQKDRNPPNPLSCLWDIRAPEIAKLRKKSAI